MEKNRKSIIWGIAIIVLGLLYLGNNLEIWGFNVFFDGWWTVFIIVPSFIDLFYKENAMSSVLGIIIGVLLLMAAQDFITWIMVWKIFIPFVIISIGISIIIKPKFRGIIRKNRKGAAEFIGIFGGVDEKISDKFLGASCVSIFGGVELDLSEAIITEDVIIDCVAIFGGVDIRLPKETIVKTAGVSIFGGSENKFSKEAKKNQPTVFVNHVSIFGGTELK